MEITAHTIIGRESQHLNIKIRFSILTPRGEGVNIRVKTFICKQVRTIWSFFNHPCRTWFAPSDTKHIANAREV